MCIQSKLFNRRYQPFTFLYEVISKKYIKKTSRIHIKEKPQIAMFSFDYISNQITLDGRYEDAILLWITENLEKYTQDKVTLDVGANIGNHSIAFSNISKEVASFEPNRKIFHLLNINKSLKSNIKIFNYGLSDKNEILNAYVPINNFGGASVRKKRIKVLRKESLTFELKKFDDIKNFSKLNIGLVKIDVEGNEYKVIKGMKHLLFSQSPIILFEKNDINIENREINFLKQMGYKYFYEFTNEANWIFKNKFLQIIEGFLLGVPSNKKKACVLTDFTKKQELIIASKFNI